MLVPLLLLVGGEVVVAVAVGLWTVNVDANVDDCGGAPAAEPVL